MIPTIRTFTQNLVPQLATVDSLLSQFTTLAEKLTEVSRRETEAANAKQLEAERLRLRADAHIAESLRASRAAARVRALLY